MKTVTSPTTELNKANSIIEKIKEYTRNNIRITIPRLQTDANTESRAEEAYLTNWTAISEFAGTYGDYQYLFEGEDDLLHLVILRQNLQPLTVEEARVVAEGILPNIPSSKIWLSPGEYTQHFYFGHDELFNI